MTTTLMQSGPQVTTRSRNFWPASACIRLARHITEKVCTCCDCDLMDATCQHLCMLCYQRFIASLYSPDTVILQIGDQNYYVARSQDWTFHYTRHEANWGDLVRNWEDPVLPGRVAVILRTQYIAPSESRKRRCSKVKKARSDKYRLVPVTKNKTWWFDENGNLLTRKPAWVKKKEG